jgi:hypothetical protein
LHLSLAALPFRLLALLVLLVTMLLLVLLVLLLFVLLLFVLLHLTTSGSQIQISAFPGHRTSIHQDRLLEGWLCPLKMDGPR